jgi:hypothetical protein
VPPDARCDFCRWQLGKRRPWWSRRRRLAANVSGPGVVSCDECHEVMHEIVATETGGVSRWRTA